MGHARLSASAAHRWMVCPGSVRLSDGIPNKETAAAAEGTYAHALAAMMLRDNYVPEFPNDEMQAGVDMYVDHIAKTYRKGDEDFVEVDLTDALQKIDPDAGGTADYVRWRAKEKHLIVTDFKYGAGHLVQPEGNPQLKMYALGALLKLGKPAEKVTVKIVQPRIEHEDGHIREWTFPASELLDFAADVAEAAARTRDANAPLVPGISQCQWCPAKRICPALEEKHHALVAADFSDLAKCTPQQLGKALDSFPLVEARIKAIREFAYAEAERGNPPTGHKLVAKRGTRKWVDEEAVRTWAEQRAIDPFEEPKMKSPAQLEKGLTKEQKKELADMTVTVSSGHTLVSNDDKRPAVHLALATEFAAIPGTAE